MDRENLIEKVRKLRNLSTSSNLNEAAAAARAAEKLIQEHCLEEAEFELAEGSQEFVVEDGLPLTDWNERQTVWQNVLLTVLSTAYTCEGIIKTNHLGKVGFYAIGRPADIATMRYQYAYFVVEMTRLAHLMAPKTLTRGGGKHWHKSFYLGGVQAIRESLVSAKQEVRQQASSTALAVIDKHMEETQNFFKEKYPKAKLVNLKSTINRDAWQKGHDAGSGLSPKPGLGSGVRGLLK